MTTANTPQELTSRASTLMWFAYVGAGSSVFRLESAPWQQVTVLG